MSDLVLGSLIPSGIFKIPREALLQTFAFIAIRGAGKTTAATILAEQFYSQSLPWIALDPTGVWWGLRAGKDGSPNGGLKGVVIIGGKHGDLPLNKGDGAKIARALIESNVCAVIDLKLESKTVYRSFVTDFCNTLMEMEPPTPRHIFVEEGPEFVPQRPVGNVMKMAHAAVDRLIRLGRNNGYGASIISQRAATIDKDVLSQCENLVALRQTMTHDRKAMEAWVQTKGEDATQFSDFLKKLAQFADGEGYFWSPAWLRVFQHIQIGSRKTFHPGATRKLDAVVKHVTLIPATDFVLKVQRQLTKKSVPVAEAGRDHQVEKAHREESERQPRPLPAKLKPVFDAPTVDEQEMNELRQENAKLREDLRKAKAEAKAANQRIEDVRALLKPQYQTMKKLFEDISTPETGGAVDRGPYAQWLEKCTKSGIKKMIEYLLEHGQGTRTQLATWAGVNPKTAYDYVGWITRNGLADAERGGMITLRKL